MFTADFETNNHAEDCRVWAWAICNIENLNLVIGKDIQSFFNYVFSKNPDVYYFHNLKFDGQFILSYLFKLNYKHTMDRNPSPGEFYTLISDKNVFYQIIIGYKGPNGKARQLVIQDSLKLLPFSVEKIANDFQLPIKKGKIDYNIPRPVGYNLTQEEKDYIRNDVEIMARALKIFFEQGLTKMTIGSNALTHYKTLVGGKTFSRRFPGTYV